MSIFRPVALDLYITMKRAIVNADIAACLNPALLADRATH